MTFDEQIQQSVQDSLLKLIRSGEWCRIDYAAKIPLGADFLRKIQAGVNMDNVMEIVTAEIEGHIADAIIRAMTTEIATDVKKIMSNTELREDLRSVLRAKMRAARDQLVKEGP